VQPLYFDLHDDPRVQYKDLGIVYDEKELGKLGAVLDDNLKQFQRIGLSSPELASLYAFEPSKYVAAPNASDPTHFNVAPLPKSPVIMLVGSTSKNRGADLLIEAATIVHRAHPRVRLKLVLSNTGGRGNLAELKAAHAEPWIEFISADYRSLPALLAQATVCVIPHRHSRYVDMVIPVKLFDYMAAGRPVVATDCRPTTEIIRREQAGLVSDFTAAGLAAAIQQLIDDPKLAARLGASGRKAVETTYNWQRTKQAVAASLQELIRR
jgi:glycosyltransferase involved in cell wall biosynthesis